MLEPDDLRIFAKKSPFFHSAAAGADINHECKIGLPEVICLLQKAEVLKQN